MITPGDEESRAGIVTFQHPHADARCAALEERRIGISARCGALRISQHFENVPEVIDECYTAIGEMEQECRFVPLVDRILSFHD